MSKYMSKYSTNGNRHTWPAERAAQIRLVVLDVDGVLTDGSIYLDDNGLESKRFYVRDGLGMRLLLQAGLQVGLLTARQSAIVSQRAKELSLSFVHQGVKDKWLCLQRELEKTGLSTTQCAYMGDDLVDLRVLQQVGLATAPADADAEVLNRVHWVSSRQGGKGAVRELAEHVLQTQNKWDAILASLIEESSAPESTSLVNNMPQKED